MTDGLVFGWRTAILLVAIIQLLALAAALSTTFANRIANRTLALFLLAMAALVTPWMIGFAGFYDKWPWLSFAPLQITLVIAPLYWLYTHALVHGRWPAGGWRHLLPGIAQFAFLAICFCLPLEAKWAWDSASEAAYGVLTGLGVIAGIAVYGRRSHALLVAYRRALADQRSDDHRFAARWLSNASIAMGVLMLVWAAHIGWDALSPLGYRGLMGLYVAFAAFALYLGIEGWRHAALPFPAMASLAMAPAAANAEPMPVRDWKAQGKSWAAEVEAQGWYRDPDISLAVLARRLGTNSGYLSRAINEGLGLGFSAFIAGLRSDEVARAIDAGRSDDLLSLALDAGFSSKASFNRAFLARTGMTPSTYRRAVTARNPR